MNQEQNIAQPQNVALTIPIQQVPFVQQNHSNPLQQNVLQIVGVNPRRKAQGFVLVRSPLGLERYI